MVVIYIFKWAYSVLKLHCLRVIYSPGTTKLFACITVIINEESWDEVCTYRHLPDDRWFTAHHGCRQCTQQVCAQLKVAGKIRVKESEATELKWVSMKRESVCLSVLCLFVCVTAGETGERGDGCEVLQCALTERHWSAAVKLMIYTSSCLSSSGPYEEGE